MKRTSEYPAFGSADITGAFFAQRVGLPHKRRQIDCGLYGESQRGSKGNLRGKKKSIFAGETKV